METDGRALVRRRIFSEVIRRGEAELARLEQMNRNAPEVNREFLKKCLKDNAGTEYGKKYGFDSIRSYEEYAGRVPVSDWEVFRPYADRIAETRERGVLTADPVACFYFTSGTTNRKKRVPCTRRAMETQNRYLVDAMFGAVARELGDIWSDGAILLVNEGAARMTDGGFPVFNISGRLIHSQQKLASFLYASPPEAMIPKGTTESMALHARAALQNAAVSDIQSSFVVFPLEMMQYIDNHWESLAEQIAQGTLDPAVRMPPEARASLEQRLRPDPDRAELIHAVYRNRRDEPVAPRIWPGLRVVSAGTGADFGFFERRLRTYTGDGIRFYHRGYTASEGVFTIPEALDDRDGVLLSDTAFYEFRLADGRILTMDRLEKGMVCSLVVTTGSGLYRYPMGDRVEVTGFSGLSPRLKLLGRENRQLDLTGEKLDLPLVSGIVERACAAAGTSADAYAVYANREALPLPRYDFFLELRIPADTEELRRALTAELRRVNEDLDRKFDSGKFGLPAVLTVKKGTWEAFMRPIRERAEAEGRQAKPVCLLQDETQAAFFAARAL